METKGFSMQQFNGKEETKFILSKSTIRSAVAAALYSLNSFVPNPRNICIIMDKVYKYLNCAYEKEFIELDVNQIRRLGDDLCDNIKELRNLNLSQTEIDSGITDVDDPERKCTVFVTSRYTPNVPAEEEFMDLDAFAQHLAYLICMYSSNC